MRSRVTNGGYVWKNEAITAGYANGLAHSHNMSGGTPGVQTNVCGIELQIQ